MCYVILYFNCVCTVRRLAVREVYFLQVHAAMAGNRNDRIKGSILAFSGHYRF
jgi:hypothetical protein